MFHITMDQMLPDYPEDCRVGQDSRGITMIDYGYDAPPHGYDLSGIPIHSIKHEHYKLEDSSVNLIMSKIRGKATWDVGTDMIWLLAAGEDERRRLRRERNKVAASKCRNKRKEHIKLLMKESEELENRNSSLQIEITTLQSEIKQLESMLDSHRCSMSCKVSN